jgi:hypothetical protein
MSSRQLTHHKRKENAGQSAAIRRRINAHLKTLTLTELKQAAKALGVERADEWLTVAARLPPPSVLGPSGTWGAQVGRGGPRAQRSQGCERLVRWPREALIAFMVAITQTLL